ncbi:N-acetylmuramoyl-L-alanine amidase [Rhizobium sp. BK399]|uniref:N-acetylmuramoyl-L-alanine amidase n=1 Tax=Rhizobium sp. BK399 TaxID=2587063 RepID=UPI001610F5AF|nr:N-acetylmuramoyl-L-alanine amidase [Rhizobium sp. BK399]MBB3545467.1 peptidoglycan hydrolase-like protein with peptidoglycan-binding domain [Rhizobium sp. BK399]
MVYLLTWLPEVLRHAGLKVAETNGWASRGTGEMGRVRGVICHHTGSIGTGNMPTLNALISGRGGNHPLSGPLAQLGLGVDGTYYLVAAGKANHAGPGEWRGIRTGNSSFIGIEAENPGTPNAQWPDWQMDAYRRGVAAILNHIGETSDMCCGHKEYALPDGRKPDPLFNMDVFRDGVKRVMSGTVTLRPPVPAFDAISGHRTLERGARGSDVVQVQRAVGTEQDGRFGPVTEAAVRCFQQRYGLRPDGIVGPLTWSKIDEIPQPIVLAAGLTDAANDTLPEGARRLLDLIGDAEAPGGYDVLFGNNQHRLPRPLSSMSLADVILNGPNWRRMFRSPACGRYQFMTTTLMRLRDTLHLSGGETFGSALQDQLGYTLLKFRGYERFMARKISLVDFGLGLAQEWASFPVLQAREGAHRTVRRGETFYAGDGLNKALMAPETVEHLLVSLLESAPSSRAA